MLPGEAITKTAEHMHCIAVAMEEAAANIRILDAELSLYLESHSLGQGAQQLEHGFRPHWPHAPASEQWTKRGGDTRYLYLYWKRALNGDYRSPTPGPKPTPTRKTYIGCDPHRIRLARLMVENFQAQLALRRVIHRAQSDLSQLAWDAGHMATRAERARDDTTDQIALREEIDHGV